MSSAIPADYAIFTSIRSPMGNGYQVVAASRGVTAAEKSEIQRRSPSHNALCSADEHAAGLSAYPLASGRYVVALSRYGNLEYSGRGGRCIDSHIVILDDDAYAAFDCNPLRVQQALVDIIGPDPVSRPPRQLKPLELSPDSSPPGGTITLPPAFGTNNDGLRLTFLAKWMLAHQPVIVLGAEAPLSALEWTLMTLPAGWRHGLAISAGIKYATTRQLNWVMLDDSPADVQRMIGGHDIGAFSITEELEADPHPYDEWFNFVQRWWRKNRFDEISRITSLYSQPDPLDDLSRIIAMYTDRDIARLANKETRARLHQTYANWLAGNALEREIAREIAELTQPEPDKLTEASSPPSDSATPLTSPPGSAETFSPSSDPPESLPRTSDPAGHAAGPFDPARHAPPSSDPAQASPLT